MGSGSSVLAQSPDSIPEFLDIETARAICLSNFGEAYVGQFSEAVFYEHAVDGALARRDFLKLVQTEADSSLGDVWEVNTSNAGERNESAEKASLAKSPRRRFTTEEQSLAKDTPLTKLLNGMKRLNNTGRTPLVLIAIGKYNPVNLMHPHMFEVARQYLERHTHYGVIGGFMCPMHDKLVKNACRGDVRQAIPGRRRLDMCQIATSESSWVDVGRWEIVQKTGHLDYPEILHRMSDLFKTFFQDHHNCADGKLVHTMYLCGGDDLVKCTPDNLREYGCVCVTRPGWIQKCADVFTEQWKEIVHVVEDTSVVDVALADLSSTKVRRLIKLGKDVKNLVGGPVHTYMKKHKILAKMHPKAPDEWTTKDASMARLKELEIPPFPRSQLMSSLQGTEETGKIQGNQALENKSELESSDAVVESTSADSATGNESAMGNDCNDLNAKTGSIEGV